MSDYDAIMRVLRTLSVQGNPVATTYLHLLFNCDPGERAQILRQITTFATSFTYDIGRVGPSEFKDGEATQTPIMHFSV